ncbi:coiled-coil domain-containing protein 191 isoform X2 [Rissa tridactyla]|uniref:coiled-coil domain-containing protein 191 isoform X2 n=1 Tax=Rissa tridactyla TaxID=75485 RepID=UPI0023BAEAE3|nr:coiled-coil domain-containing protein 191 isoform X2 [Rissa tridactyla]
MEKPPLPARCAAGPAERDGRPPGVPAAFPRHRPRLYRWRRLTAGAGPKRVEQAPGYAVSEVFSLQKSRYPQGPYGSVTCLETVEQLQDHDEAYEEAQELLSNWMKSKLQVELMSNGEEKADSVLLEKPSAAPLKYERFDDLCSYLEHELESSSVQEYLQHLLQSKAVNCGIAEDLRLEDIKEKQKLADPRIIMELRHKQVKENRMRRQKALELQRQEKSLKKSVLSEAKLQAQEEERRKALKAKKEEEEIQREMVKLRKEMAEKRHTMAEAWRTKTQLSVEHNQRRLLRCCFLAWQRWSHAETEKRELQIKREETKRKMAQLLEAVSRGKGGLDRPLEVKKPGRAEVKHHQDLQQDKPTETCLIQKEPDQTRDHSCWNAGRTSHSYRKPKFAWEVTLKHAAPSAQDQAVYRNQTATLRQQFHTTGPKTAPAYGSRFEHRHAFQQRLIEEQRQQLQKQQELILELQENQRLSRAKEEAAQAMAVTQPLNNSASQTKEENPKTEKKSRCKNTTHLSPPVSHGPENTRAAMPGRRPSSQLTSAHPILKAMEERATQRAERRRKLEEAKQRREEEKLAQLKAEEEARQRKEVEEKEAQQKKRREERRQQKLKELEKQRRLEKEQQLQRKARDHYEKVLLRKLGIVPWKRLREQAKENLGVAQRQHCLSLRRKCLMTWLQHTQGSIMEKVSRAEDFYCHMLLRQGFRNWLKYKDYLSTMEERASTLHTACLMRKYFWAWFDLVMEEKSTLWEKLKIATEHSNKRVTLNAFKAWRQYPLLMKKEREREERRNQLRRKVAEILPDFQT